MTFAIVFTLGNKSKECSCSNISFHNFSPSKKPIKNRLKYIVICKYIIIFQIFDEEFLSENARFFGIV